MWLSAGFCAFGGLVGLLSGLTSAEISQSLLALLFGLISGSIVVLLKKLTPDDRVILGKMLLGFSGACALGLALGVLTKVHQWLGTPPAPTQAVNSVYLRANDLSERSAIERQYRTDQITGDQAFERLNSLLKSAAGEQ